MYYVRRAAGGVFSFLRSRRTSFVVGKGKGARVSSRGSGPFLALLENLYERLTGILPFTTRPCVLAPTLSSRECGSSLFPELPRRRTLYWLADRAPYRRGWEISTTLTPPLFLGTGLASPQSHPPVPSVLLHEGVQQAFEGLCVSMHTKNTAHKNTIQAADADLGAGRDRNPTATGVMRLVTPRGRELPIKSILGTWLI